MIRISSSSRGFLGFAACHILDSCAKKKTKKKRSQLALPIKSLSARPAAPLPGSWA